MSNVYNATPIANKWGRPGRVATRVSCYKLKTSLKNAVLRLNQHRQFPYPRAACLQTNVGFQQVRAVLGRFMCVRVCKVNFMGWLNIVIKLLGFHLVTLMLRSAFHAATCSSNTQELYLCGFL